MYSWGKNSDYQCGHKQKTNNGEDYVFGPTLINIDNNIDKIFCGSNNSYLLDIDGNLWVFGQNMFQDCMFVKETEVKQPTKISKDVINKAIGDNNGIEQVYSFYRYDVDKKYSLGIIECLV